MAADMDYFLIKNGIIENRLTIVGIDDLSPWEKDGAILVPITEETKFSDIGWAWNNGPIAPPEPERPNEPSILSPAQFHGMIEILGMTGTLLQKIRELPQGQRGQVYGKVYYSSSYRRDHPLTEILRQRMGLTKQEFDAAWEQAKSLEA